MGLIQRGDILARVAKALGVKEKSPAPTLVDSVQPVILVGDARDEPIGAFERPFVGYETFTAAAGQFTAIECLNPADSSVDVIIDYIVLSTAAGQLVDFRLSGQVLANLTTKATQYRDPTPGQPLAEIRAESLAAAVLGAGTIRVLTTGLVVPMDIRFTPGTALLLCSQSAAFNFACTFFGREIVRPFGPRGV